MMNKQKRRAFFLTALPILSLILLISVFLNKMVFSNLILARGDTFLYFYPYWHSAADALRTGRIPFWNPNIFMGAPLLANSQMGFFYPFNWPVWLLFETPYAISASIFLHLLVAGIGSYLAARRVMLLGQSAAFVTAVVFSLGGYLTAQVEHINQLQGLAWLPWLLLVVGTGQPRSRRAWLGSLTAAALLFALQLLGGHAQTTFISAVALVVWILAQHFSQRVIGEKDHTQKRLRSKTLLAALIMLLLAGLTALLLAAIQLLPTLELTALSSRRGGLLVNEVLSFSLHPLHLTRTLLPAYPQSLFSEYVAFLPLIVLALAFIGAWQWRKRVGVLPALIWIVLAFLLAFGAFNPLNWLLVQLPGFNLFRVPARWLVLYALGVALLAGAGWQIVLDQIRIGSKSDDHKKNSAALKTTIFKPLLFFLTGTALLIAWGFLAGTLVGILPTGPEAPYETPSLQTLLIWSLELLLLVSICCILYWGHDKVDIRLLSGFFLTAIVAALFAASRGLPYNNLTTPEAYFDLRPPAARILAEAGPPARLISLSDIFFDPGDQAEIDTIYHDQLTEAAAYDYTIAIKQKELIAPNLPMLYGLASVDGFDGGVLPIQSYTDQMRLILPEGVVTSDGRLRENLETVPEARWLDLFNAQFLITDKVGDIWQEDVFFDRQHPAQLKNGQEIAVGYLPEFEATELRLLTSEQPELVKITTIDDRIWEIDPEHIEGELYIARFPQAAAVKDITVAACKNMISSCDLLALTLVDERDGAFQSLVPGEYRLIHSGDVKIYENLDVMPRAYFVTDWQWAQDSASALDQMRSTKFDIRDTVILYPQPGENPQPKHVESDLVSGQVEIQEYLAERVKIVTNQQQDGMLILNDAYYPGWEVKIDGQPAEIYQANNLFRALFVPAGAHEIAFTFQSRSFKFGLLITISGLIITASMVAYLLISRRKQNA